MGIGGRRPEDAIPQEVIADRYAVESELGRGGMATVYLCTDRTTQAKVAVKILRAELGSAVVVERFLREIAFASELDHPRIPRVLDSGVADELPFYVMTYIDGESLRHRLDRVKQLPVEEAVSIATQVIAPTTYAHQHGIVHRDLKPGNILIAADGVYVLDFGIARALIASSDERLTSTGVAVGTPAYMSPEQALADGDLDARSDIYSLGCVLYEMIAGMPPFVGATPQAVMSRRFASPPPPLSETREGVPPHVEDAVGKALSRAPADRWQTAEEFGRALAGGVTSESVHRVRRHLESRRTTYARVIAGTILLAVIAGISLTGLMARRDHVGRAQRALASWEFEEAESALRAAVSKNADDPRAQLWLAQVLMLKGRPATEWKPLVLKAGDRVDALDSADALRAGALAALANDDFAEACSRFGQLVPVVRRFDPRDSTPPLALADCLRGDPVVIPDAATPSGYRFRASFHLIDSLYVALLDRHKSEASAYAVIAPRLERVLSVDARIMRRGTLAGSTNSSMYALPTLQGDTVAYVPYPITSAGPMVRLGDPRAIDAAIARNQQRLRATAEDWIRAAPADPDSHEMLAGILENAGELEGQDDSALSQLTTARRLAKMSPGTDAESFLRKVRLGHSHVRVLLRLNRFDSAGVLADSILSIPEPRGLDDEATRSALDYRWLLAALRGRVNNVIAMERRNAGHYPVMLPGGVETLPVEIARDAIALTNYAAFGGPRDSIVGVTGRLEERISALVPPNKVQGMRRAIFARPFALAVSAIGPGPAAALGPTGDPLARVIEAYARNNVRTARTLLDAVDVLRADRAPGQITMDVTFQHAWLRAALGDTVGAARLLDNSLRGMTKAPPSMLGQRTLIASLVRVMILRSELAAAAGQTGTAQTWAAAAIQLWGRGDPFIIAQLNSLRIRQ